MCSFLTLGVEGKRSAALETALLTLKLEVSREVNPHVVPLFPAGDVLFMVMRGGCSCDLRPLAPDSPRDEKRRRRGQTGSKRPNLYSDALLAALRLHAPVRAFFHEVSGDQFKEAVPQGAVASVIS
ncbi:MAG: hypothetical protein Q8L48_22215 [Archangium sp.]|nr:hypothetical protein [Archangium sp.]